MRECERGSKRMNECMTRVNLDQSAPSIDGWVYYQRWRANGTLLQYTFKEFGLWWIGDAAKGSRAIEWHDELVVRYRVQSREAIWL